MGHAADEGVRRGGPQDQGGDDRTVHRVEDNDDPRADRLHRQGLHAASEPGHVVRRPGRRGRRQGEARPGGAGIPPGGRVRAHLGHRRGGRVERAARTDTHAGARAALAVRKQARLARCGVARRTQRLGPHIRVRLPARRPGRRRQGRAGRVHPLVQRRGSAHREHHAQPQARGARSAQGQQGRRDGARRSARQPRRHRPESVRRTRGRQPEPRGRVPDEGQDRRRAPIRRPRRDPRRLHPVRQGPHRARPCPGHCGRAQGGGAARVRGHRQRHRAWHGFDLAAAGRSRGREVRARTDHGDHRRARRHHAEGDARGHRREPEPRGRAHPRRREHRGRACGPARRGDATGRWAEHGQTGRRTGRPAAQAGRGAGGGAQEGAGGTKPGLPEVRRRLRRRRPGRRGSVREGVPGGPVARRVRRRQGRGRACRPPRARAVPDTEDGRAGHEVRLGGRGHQRRVDVPVRRADGPRGDRRDARRVPQAHRLRAGRRPRNVRRQGLVHRALRRRAAADGGGAARCAPQRPGTRRGRRVSHPAAAGRDRRVRRLAGRGQHGGPVVGVSAVPAHRLAGRRDCACRRQGQPGLDRRGGPPDGRGRHHVRQG
nr:hypothetical protein [Kibdelosporangium sp. MJ126-NF4]